MSTRTSTTNITTSSPEPAPEAIAAKTSNEPSVAAKAPQSAQIVATAPPSADTEASAREFVFFMESSNKLDAVNPASGSCGLAQSLPCAKLASACPEWRTDRACQERWFDTYARQRFGSWKAAKDYWQCIGTCTNKLGTITKTATWW